MTTLQTVGAVASAVTALAGVFFWIVWKFKKTPDQQNQEVDQKIEQDKEKAKQTGRPV